MACFLPAVALISFELPVGLQWVLSMCGSLAGLPCNEAGLPPVCAGWHAPCSARFRTQLCECRSHAKFVLQLLLWLCENGSRMHATMFPGAVAVQFSAL
mmetsp:Transcript_61040/g.145437  ORF Transcript_61040/g.145437 Transcript_61040/m.145437 type:complete len:99 (+) Transcript_61040:168-464(+)